MKPMSALAVVTLATFASAQELGYEMGLDIYVEDALSHTAIPNATIADLTTGEVLVTNSEGIVATIGGAAGFAEHIFEVIAPGYPQHTRLVALAGETTSGNSEFSEVAALRLSPAVQYLSPVIGVAGGSFRASHDTTQTIDGAPFMQNIRIVVEPGTWQGRYRLGVTLVDPGAFTTGNMPASSIGGNLGGTYAYPLAELRMTLLDANSDPVELGVLAKPIEVEIGSARVDTPMLPGLLVDVLNYDTNSKQWQVADFVGTPSVAGGVTHLSLNQVQSLSILPINSLGLGDSTNFCEWKLLLKHTWACGGGEASPIDSVTVLDDPCGQVFGSTTINVDESYSTQVESQSHAGFSAKAKTKLLELGFQAGGKTGSTTSYSKKYKSTKSAGSSVPRKSGTLNLYPIETKYTYELVCSDGLTDTASFTVLSGSCWAVSELANCQ